MKWSKIKESVMFPLSMLLSMGFGFMFAIWLMWNTFKCSAN